MTLKAQFSLSFMAYTLLVLAGFGATYYVVEKRMAAQSQLAEQIKTVEKTASVCREMNLNLNAVIAVNYLSLLKKDSSIIFAACLNAHGLIQAHSDPQMIGRHSQDADDLKELAEYNPEPHFHTRALPSLPHPHPRPLAGEEAFLPLPLGKGTGREISAQYRGQGSESFSRGRVRGDDSVLAWYAPVLVGGKKVGMAQVGYSLGALEKETQRKLWTTLQQLLFVGGCTLVFAVALSFLLAWRLSGPIGKIAEAARAVGGGNLDYQVPAENRSDELRSLGQEINAMVRKLKALDELKDEFISHVSHELRNPMAAIKMFAEYMLEGDPNRDQIIPKHREMITIMMDNAMRLNVYVTNILDAAKIKAGQMEYHRQPVDANKVLESVRNLFKIVAQTRNVELCIEPGKDMPLVLVDPERFDQVIANLISNALKFTNPGGKITLAARPLPGNQEAEVSVADTGKGMPKEALRHLFERFKQVDVAAQRSDKIQGSGLGLYLVKQTIEAMGGRISVESELGRGTKFSIQLPISGEANHDRT